MMAGEEYEAPDPRAVYIAGMLMNEFDMRHGMGASKCRNAARDIVKYLDDFEVEQAALKEFREHYYTFCDCDPFDGSDTFAERMEARGLIRLRPATNYDIEASFAAERGIEKDGYLWDLTPKGRAVLDGRMTSHACTDTAEKQGK